MASVLVAIRDLLIGLTLAWVGISLERPTQRVQDPSASACEVGGSAVACEALETVKREQRR